METYILFIQVSATSTQLSLHQDTAFPAHVTQYAKLLGLDSVSEVGDGEQGEAIPEALSTEGPSEDEAKHLSDAQ